MCASEHWDEWLYKLSACWFNKSYTQLCEDMRIMGPYACKPIGTLCFHVSQHLNNNCDPTTVAKACSLNDWPMWENAMAYELKSFGSQKVFSLAKTTPRGVVIEYLWGYEINIEAQ